MVGKGLCRKHYVRMQRKGDTSDVRKNAARKCEWPGGCDRSATVRGRCGNHKIRPTKQPRRLACPACGAGFVGYRSDTVFCSRTCKAKGRTGDGRGAEAARRSYFKRQYGLTVDQVDEMLLGGCAICGTIDWPGRHNRGHIDHDHATGKVRGVLCSECNTGLGKFRDDPELVDRAAAYLRSAVDLTP